MLFGLFCLTYTQLRCWGSHYIIGTFVSLLVKNSSHYPLATLQTLFRLLAPKNKFQFFDIFE